MRTICDNWLYVLNILSSVNKDVIINIIITPPRGQFNSLWSLGGRGRRWRVVCKRYHYPVWSESLLSAWRKLGSLATHLSASEDSDQTGRMPRLIWVFAGRTCHFVGFVMRRLIIKSNEKCGDCHNYNPRPTRNINRKRRRRRRRKRKTKKNKTKKKHTHTKLRIQKKNNNKCTRSYFPQARWSRC